MSVVCQPAPECVHHGWWCYVEAYGEEGAERALGRPRRRRSAAPVAEWERGDALLPESRPAPEVRLRWRRFDDVEQVMRWLRSEVRVQLQELDAWDRWLGYRWLCQGQRETRQRLGAGEEFAVPARLHTPFGLARVRWTARPVLFLHPAPELYVCPARRGPSPLAAGPGAAVASASASRVRG